jgi:protein arginine kinase activator
MQCEVCGKAAATLHFTEIVNNKMTELHLCTRCADQKGLHGGVGNKGKFAIADFMAEMVDEVSTAEEDKIGHVQCSRCGMFYSSFRETGHLGCAECYTAFRQSLRPLLRRIHGEPRHVGKAPKRDGEGHERRREVQRLHEELERALGRDDYETAATIRDSIRSLERAQSSGGAPAEGV